MDYNSMNNGLSNNNYNRDNYGRNLNSNFRGGFDSDEVVSVGTWIGIMILLAIPIVNFIALLIMTFSNGNKNIKNYAKASLIIMGIAFFLLLMVKGCSI